MNEVPTVFSLQSRERMGKRLHHVMWESCMPWDALHEGVQERYRKAAEDLYEIGRYEEHEGNPDGKLSTIPTKYDAACEAELRRINHNPAYRFEAHDLAQGGLNPS